MLFVYLVTCILCIPFLPRLPLPSKPPQVAKAAESGDRAAMATGMMQAAAALVNMAAALFATRRFEQARLAYEQVGRARPGSGGTGGAYAGLGRREGEMRVLPFGAYLVGPSIGRER